MQSFEYLSKQNFTIQKPGQYNNTNKAYHDQQSQLLINNPNLNVNDFKMNHLKFKNKPISNCELKQTQNNGVSTFIVPKDIHSKNFVSQIQNNTSQMNIKNNSNNVSNNTQNSPKNTINIVNNINKQNNTSNPNCIKVPNNNIIDFRISTSSSLQINQDKTEQQPALINKIEIGNPIQRATKQIFNTTLSNVSNIGNTNIHNRRSFHNNYESVNSQNAYKNTEINTKTIQSNLQQNNIQAQLNIQQQSKQSQINSIQNSYQTQTNQQQQQNNIHTQNNQLQKNNIQQLNNNVQCLNSPQQQVNFQRLNDQNLQNNLKTQSNSQQIHNEAQNKNQINYNQNTFQQRSSSIQNNNNNQNQIKNSNLQNNQTYQQLQQQQLSQQQYPMSEQQQQQQSLIQNQIQKNKIFQAQQNTQQHLINQKQQYNSHYPSIFTSPKPQNSSFQQNYSAQVQRQNSFNQQQEQKGISEFEYNSNFQSIPKEQNKNDETNNELKEKQRNQEIGQNKIFYKGSAQKPETHQNINCKQPQQNPGDKQGGGPNCDNLNIDLKKVNSQANKILQAQFKFPTPSHFDRDSFKSKRSSVQSNTGRSDNGSVNTEQNKTQQNNGSNNNLESLNYEKISQSDKSNFFDSIKEFSDNFITKTQQFFQNNLKKINSRLGCSCDLNLKADSTCSIAYQWLSMNNRNKKENLQYLKNQYESIKNAQIQGLEANMIQIEKDLSRTFPQLEMFQNEKYIKSLRNILQAVAKYSPKIGYVQGMNMIAASLLYHAEEYVSFWVMQNIFEKLEMYDIYEPQLPGLSKHIQLLDIITLTRLPDLYSHFCQQQITFDMFCSPWIFSLFGVVLTPQKLTVLYTELLEEGWVMFYRLVIAFLCYNKEFLFQQDMGDMLVTLTSGNYKFDSQEKWEQLIKYSKNVNIDSDFINSMLNSYDSEKKQFNMKQL